MNTTEKCQQCGVNSYSYQGSTSCSPCPGSYTSALYQSYCECPEGLYWNFTHSNCVGCPLNHYNEQTNQTQCRKCPNNSSSEPGSERCRCAAGYKLLNSSYCELCPENHFSKTGSLRCKRCPHFKAAAPGSGYCYRCTLGQYWENHTCVQCPAHLYGDGVHCLECPDQFQVDQGLCYKVASRESLSYVVEPLEIAVIVLSSTLFLVCIVTVVITGRITAISRKIKRTISRTAGTGESNYLEELLLVPDQELGSIETHFLERQAVESDESLSYDNDQEDTDIKLNDCDEEKSDININEDDCESNIYEDI